jgi:hypothetical protein
MRRVMAMIGATLAVAAAVTAVASPASGGGLRAANVLPYIEQDELHRSVAVAQPGSILDGWGNRDLDIDAFTGGARVDAVQRARVRWGRSGSLRARGR